MRFSVTAGILALGSMWISLMESGLSLLAATTVQLVGTKSDHFGWADGVSLAQNVVKGVPVKAVATILNILPYAVVSLEERNIRSIKDLEGKTLAITPGDGLTQTWPAVVAANKLNPDSIKLVHMDPKAKIRPSPRSAPTPSWEAPTTRPSPWRSRASRPGS